MSMLVDTTGATHGGCGCHGPGLDFLETGTVKSNDS